MSRDIDTIGYNPSALYPNWEGLRWYDCERCRFSFIETDTLIESQTGKRVCNKCLDQYDDESHGTKLVGDGSVFRLSTEEKS